VPCGTVGSTCSRRIGCRGRPAGTARPPISSGTSPRRPPSWRGPTGLGHVRLAVAQPDLVERPLLARCARHPPQEYRTPTDDEWHDFQQHFQTRKVELGDCGRPYGTPCQHEHTCIRCPMLRCTRHNATAWPQSPRTLPSASPRPVRTTGLARSKEFRSDSTRPVANSWTWIAYPASRPPARSTSTCLSFLADDTAVGGVGVASDHAARMTACRGRAG
jgi:hypothetical protein